MNLKKKPNIIGDLEAISPVVFTQRGYLKKT